MHRVVFTKGTNATDGASQSLFVTVDDGCSKDTYLNGREKFSDIFGELSSSLHSHLSRVMFRSVGTYENLKSSYIIVSEKQFSKTFLVRFPSILITDIIIINYKTSFFLLFFSVLPMYSLRTFFFLNTIRSFFFFL